MKERKGLVIKVCDGRVLVLSEGEFIYVEINGKYEKGQEITFYTKTETKTVLYWNRVIGYASIPALVSLFLLVVFPFTNNANLPSEKHTETVMRPVIPKRVTPVKTELETKPDSRKDVKEDQPRKEIDMQEGENKQTIPKKREKRKETKQTNNEQKPTENSKPAQEPPSLEEKLPAPTPEPEPPKESEPRPDSFDSNDRLITVAVDSKEISISIAKIGLKVPLRKKLY
jgi:hypothetical protein